MYKMKLSYSKNPNQQTQFNKNQLMKTIEKHTFKRDQIVLLNFKNLINTFVGHF